MNVKAMYFSATGTTEKIIKELAAEISMIINGNKDVEYLNFTLPEVRKKPVHYLDKDIVIVGVPVYAGRVPNVLLNYLNTVKSDNSPAVAVVVYGNRNYDDALIELKDILENGGFDVLAACSFIGEHSFSRVLAKGRPDREDLAVVLDFAMKISGKLKHVGKNIFKVKGEKPYRPYYKPVGKNGNPVDIRKVKPRTNEKCIDCKLCAEVCPMGSIDYNNVAVLNGICIKCGACVKKCPENAKYFDDENYLKHLHELEEEFKNRREPELYI